MYSRNPVLMKGVYRKKRFLSTQGIVKISILSVLAFLIMLVEIPVFFFPGFLKIDLSDLSPLIGGFAIGPVAGVIIELIKNLLHFVTKSDTGGVGELANFLIGTALILPAAFIYKKNRTKKGALIGIIIGIVMMCGVGALTNYYILLPFYGKFMPMDQIVALGSAANPAIKDIKTLILYGIVPFNLFKGVILGILTSILYKRLSPIIKL